MVLLCHGRCSYWSRRSDFNSFFGSGCALFLGRFILDVLVGHHLLVNADLACFDATVQDRMVQGAVNHTEAAHWLLDTRLFQCHVVRTLQRTAAILDLLDPGIKSFVAQTMELEAHVGETGTAVVGR